jgi:cytochrome c biogenesis protein CcmG/thiol:disulfide interchange protein DsbE
MSRVRRFAVLMTSVVALAVACTSSPPGEHPAVRTLSGTMPAIEALTLDGGSISPSDYAGRPVVVNFWATWCGPCRREQPLLASAARDLGERATFIGIDYEDQDDAARDWLERYDVPYANVADPSGDLADGFGVTVGLPTTFVIDADGRMRFRVMGEIDRETLDDLLGRVS